MEVRLSQRLSSSLQNAKQVHKPWRISHLAILGNAIDVMPDITSTKHLNDEALSLSYCHKSQIGPGGLGSRLPLIFDSQLHTPHSGCLLMKPRILFRLMGQIMYFIFLSQAQVCWEHGAALGFYASLQGYPRAWDSLWAHMTFFLKIGHLLRYPGCDHWLSTY